MFRNFHRQTFNPDGFDRVSENSILVFNTNGKSDDFDRAMDRYFFIHVYMLKIDMIIKIVYDDMTLDILNNCYRCDLLIFKTQIDKMGKMAIPDDCLEFVMVDFD